MVTLTELAAREVKGIIERQDQTAKEEGKEAPRLYLRVGVKGGGCSGFNYSLDLTETVGENDEIWNQHGSGLHALALHHGV